MSKAGDVYAIATKNGNAYFQYVRKVPSLGYLIRILPGMYESEPDLEALVETETNFWVFFPVVAAHKRGLIQKIKNFPIPSHSKEIPVFRTGVPDPSTRRVETWWLWNGEDEWKVGEITDEQRKLPIRGIWNDTLLIQRIEEGWLPEKDKR